MTNGHLTVLAIATVCAVLLVLAFRTRHYIWAAAVRPCWHWLSGRCTNKFFAGDVGAIVHFLAWGFAMVNAMRMYVNVTSPVGPKSEEWPWYQWMVWLSFGLVSAVQQFTVMRDFQQMGASRRSMSADYGPWIDMRIEIMLRWVIILSLYVGVGEFVRIPGLEEMKQFVLGAIAVFIGCMFWNIGALIVARHIHANHDPQVTPLMRLTHEEALIGRLGCFVAASALGAGYWVTALLGWSVGPFIAGLLVIVYIVLLMAVVALRTDVIVARIMFWKHEAGVNRRRFTRPQRRAWQEEIERAYEGMIRASNAGGYRTTCANIEVEVLPEVYAPGVFGDSEWYAEALRPLVNGKSVLEIGTGTGIIAIASIRNGARRCLATDWNRHAVDNARRNVAAHGLGGQIEVRGGNVFEYVREDEKFDIVFWAHPFNWTKKKIERPLRLSGMDYRYRGIEAYIAGAARHTARDGMILLGTGESADVVRIIRYALKSRMYVKILGGGKVPLRVGGQLQVSLYLCQLVGWD